MIGTFDATTIVVEGVEGVPLTIVGMGFEGLEYLSDSIQYPSLYDHMSDKWRCVYHV
jgi:hypothetical protein